MVKVNISNKKCSRCKTSFGVVEIEFNKDKKVDICDECFYEVYRQVKGAEDNGN